MSQELRASPQSDGLPFINGRSLSRLDGLRQVEAKYLALLFKQQLTAFLEKLNGMMGADYYQTEVEIASLLAEEKAPIGVGENTEIRRLNNNKLR